MSMIFVSPDFPLNRRMRKAVQRGKLQVFRDGGEHSALGGGMASGLIPPFRIFSSSLVCFASREGDSGATGGGDGKPLPQYLVHAREAARKAEEAARLGKRNEDAFMWHFIFADACNSGYRHGPEDTHHEFYLSMCNSRGREEVDKRIWNALVFFLGCFREDAESVCEQLKNAKIKVGDYPRQYEKLEKTQRSLVESVDKKLLGLHMSREGAKAHQSYIEPILKFMGPAIPKGLADDDYSYYLNSPEAKEVKAVGEKIAKMHQERFFAEKQKCDKTEIWSSISKEQRFGVLDGLEDLFSHGVSEVFEGWKKNRYHFNWSEMEDAHRDLENSGYFTPDNWVRNLGEIPPVVKGPLQFCKPVRIRLEEIRRSYFFGNWLSVIALSRCLMEYVLIQALGKDAKSGRKENGGYKPLGALIAEMSGRMRELQMDMESIKERGNYIMHPRDKGGDILSRSEQDAQDCLRGIVRIVSVLGGKETIPTRVPPVKQRKRPVVKKNR